VKRLIVVATFALLLAAAVPAAAQCVMCSTGAQASGAKAQRSMLHGVVLLLVPPVTMMAGLIGFAFFHRRDS
jgi:hypothetical protein